MLPLFFIFAVQPLISVQLFAISLSNILLWPSPVTQMVKNLHTLQESVHPSGSSQCTSPKHPVSCIEPGLATHFIYDIIHISMPFSQIIPPSPSPTESKRLSYTSCFNATISLHSWDKPNLVMLESSEKMWSTAEGTGKPLQYSCLENPMNSMKRQKIGH